MRSPDRSSGHRDTAVRLACCLPRLLLLALSQTAAGADAAAQKTEAKDKPARDEESEEGVKLKARRNRENGHRHDRGQPIMHTPEAAGFGWSSPTRRSRRRLRNCTTARPRTQSRSALLRAQRLAGTPGAMPADTQETAERQAHGRSGRAGARATRLSAMFGQNPPWKKHESSRSLLELAARRHQTGARDLSASGAVGDAAPGQRCVWRDINATPGSKSW